MTTKTIRLAIHAAAALALAAVLVPAAATSDIESLLRRLHLETIDGDVVDAEIDATHLRLHVVRNGVERRFVLALRRPGDILLSETSIGRGAIQGPSRYVGDEQGGVVHFDGPAVQYLNVRIAVFDKNAESEDDVVNTYSITLKGDDMACSASVQSAIGNGYGPVDCVVAATPAPD